MRVDVVEIGEATVIVGPLEEVPIEPYDFDAMYAFGYFKIRKWINKCPIKK